jgi:hypothetical protein
VSNFSEIIKEGIGSCFQIKGEIVKSEGKGQLIEMLVKSEDLHYVKIVGTCNQGEYKLISGKNKIKLEVKYIININISNLY